MQPDELTAQQRTALLVWWAANGDRLTTAELASKLGVQRRQVLEIIDQISAVIPLSMDAYARVQIMARC